MFFIIFFTNISYSQIQKVFCGYPSSHTTFGSNNSIEGDYVFIESVAGDIKQLDFPKISTLFKRKNKKWEIVYEYKNDSLDYEDGFSNYSEGKFAISKGTGNFVLLDTVLVFSKNSNENFSILDKIVVPTKGIFAKYLYKDWIIITSSEFDIIQGKTIEYIYFYKFQNGKYNLNTKIKSEVGAENSYWKILKMTDEYAIIGVNEYSEKDKHGGKVFILKYNGVSWDIIQEIFQPDPYYIWSLFGSAVTISPDNKFIGITAARDSSGLKNGGYNKGVYIYKNTGNKWELMQKINRRGKNAYGWAIDITGNDLLISAETRKKKDDERLFFEKGVIEYYKLKNGIWSKYSEIHPPKGDSTYANFGHFLDRDGETVVAGAISDTTYYYSIIEDKFIVVNGAAYIFQIPARDTLNIELCEGSNYIFNDTVITTSGHYVDTLMASYGVDSVVQLYLNVHPTPQVEIDTFICPGDSIKIGEEIFTEEGEYEVVLKSQYGCDSIVQLSLGLSEIELDSTIISDYGCGSGAIDLSIEGNNPPYAFDWSTGEQGEDISGLTKGIYRVTIQDKSGCKLQRSFIVPDSIPYLIPNAFFPSGTEEINKSFKIYQAQNVYIESTQIFDRWGEKVYESEGDEYWDGSYKGKAQAPGVYLYKIVIDSPCGKETETGQILLLR